MGCRWALPEWNWGTNLTETLDGGARDRDEERATFLKDFTSHHWINQVLVVQSRAITLARGGGDWMIWFNTILGVMYRDFPSLLEYLEKTMWLFPKYEEDKMSN